MTYAARWSAPPNAEVLPPERIPAFRAAVELAPDGVAHVSVAGEVDYATAPRLEETLRWASDRSAGDVVVDVSGLTFAGAACVNALVAIHERLGAEGRRLMLARISPRLSRLFVLCGTYFLIAAPDQPRSQRRR
jgi:anti-sigma B factor antagonist